MDKKAENESDSGLQGLGLPRTGGKVLGAQGLGKDF